MSVLSKSMSEWRGSAMVLASVRGRANEQLADLGLADRNERPRPELPREGPEPGASERERGGEVEPVDRKAARGRAGGVELRGHEPEEVEETHAEDRGRDRPQEPRVALEVPREEEEEGQREVEEEHEQAHERPARGEPPDVEGRLLGEVPRPDDQELREVHVGPQHHEGQEELAEVVDGAR